MGILEGLPHGGGDLLDGRHLLVGAGDTGDGGLIGERGRLRAVGQRGVHLAQRCGEQLQDVEPAVEQAGAGHGEVLVPDGEGRLLLRAPATLLPGGLEQGVALTQDPLIVRGGLAEGGAQLDHELVQEAAAAARVLGHERQVLGGEDHGAQDAEALTGADGGAAVDGHAVGAARQDLQLQRHGA